MPGLFITKIVKPEAFSSNRVRAEVLNALKKQAIRAHRYLNMTVQYWNNPAVFNHDIFYAGGEPTIVAYADKNANKDGASHWVKLNEGTTIRYSVMTRDFVAKTKVPGGVGTNVPGAGKAAYVDPAGRPGIEARGWSEIIHKKMQPDFTRKMREAVEKGLQPK
jgi:hypothetical protein